MIISVVTVKLTNEIQHQEASTGESSEHKICHAFNTFTFSQVGKIILRIFNLRKKKNFQFTILSRYSFCFK